MKNVQRTKNHQCYIHRQGYRLTLKAIEPPKESKQSPGITFKASPYRIYGLYAAYAFILPVLFLCIFAGYALAQENILALPIDSSQFSGYYSKDDNRFEFHLRPEYKKMAIEFNSQEASVPIQRLKYGPKKVEPNLHYYEIGRFFINNYLYKLVIYNSDGYGIGDELSLIIQINSYNNKGIMLDALVLENIFSYENIQWSQQFKVSQNLINIDYYHTDSYDLPLGKDPDKIYLVENPVPQVYTKAQYRIDNGRFIRTSKDVIIDFGF